MKHYIKFNIYMILMIYISNNYLFTHYFGKKTLCYKSKPIALLIVFISAFGSQNEHGLVVIGVLTNYRFIGWLLYGVGPVLFTERLKTNIESNRELIHKK